MKKFTVWIKKHKKLAVFLCIAIIIAAAVLTIRHKAQAAMAQLAELTEETAVVEKRSIQSSVSSTGTIISDKTRSITATLTGMEVLTVDVEVGDVVQEGDTICTFDTSKLENNLEDAEKSLSAAKTQTSVTVNNAKRALEQAVETQNYQIESAARNVISAGEAYNSARKPMMRRKAVSAKPMTKCGVQRKNSMSFRIQTRITKLHRLTVIIRQSWKPTISPYRRITQ